VKSIQSESNPLYKRLHQWTQSSHARRRSGVTLLDGIHLVQACLDSTHTPTTLIASESGANNPEVQLLLARGPSSETVVMSDRLFATLAATATPQGILALVTTPRPALPTVDDPLILLVDRLQDPGNAGAVIRAAAAAGASHVLFAKESVFAWSPRVVRASQGAHFATHVCEDVDLLALLSAQPQRAALALMPDATESLFTVALPAPLAIVVGNEGGGIQADLAARCMHARIPMPGRTESLNAAQAATIALFEVVRRNG
jgi:RNA methyltransferase, TrmH family